MAQWFKANLEFSKVLERVSPLESELHRLQSSLEESQRLIKQYEEELVQLDAAVGARGEELGEGEGGGRTSGSVRRVARREVWVWHFLQHGVVGVCVRRLRR